MRVTGITAYVLILVPVLIADLNSLNLDTGTLNMDIRTRRGQLVFYSPVGGGQRGGRPQQTP